MNRTLANESVFPIGLGCMNLSHAYGEPLSEADGAHLLEAALDLGVNHFDTATLYGFGKNETLVGSVLKKHRSQIFLASKCGMAGVDGKRVIDGRPATIKEQCDASLQRLQTDVIDLYYLHRWDKSVPIEDSVGALAELVEEGKIRHIGLSEVSGPTIHKAHQIHPIAAVQNEYSLWSRNAEYGALKACKDIGANLVAFSPLARGFLTATLRSLEQLVDNDIRINMPRFQEPHFSHNLQVLQEYEVLAQEAECTPAQLALAWLLVQDSCVIPIPGTRSVEHLKENIKAAQIQLGAEVINKAGELISQQTIAGNRYPEATLKEIDTEEI